MPNVPANAKKPADRKKPSANERRQAEESAGEYAVISRNGRDFRVSNPADWYLTTTDSLNAGRFGAWAADAIHPDDLDEFLAARLRVRDLGGVVEEVTDHFGADLGE